MAKKVEIGIDLKINAIDQNSTKIIDKIKNALDGISKGSSSSSATKGLEVELKKYQSALSNLAGKKLNSSNVTAYSKAIQQLAFQEQNLKNKINDVSNKLNNQTLALKTDKVKEAEKVIGDFANKYKLSEQDIKKLTAAQFRQIGATDDEVTARANAARTIKIYENSIQKATEEQSTATNVVNTLNNLLKTNSNVTKDASENLRLQAAAQANADKEDQKQQLINRVKYYTSWAFSINLVRQQLIKMKQTYQEIDKSLTSISMVSGISRDSLWSNIGTYNKMAQELGTTTTEVLEASKLYYQQGRNTNEVIQLTTQSLKLAAITDLDTATSTDYLTAAINGYKLEANDAIMVTDTWAQLAARTAVDVDELAIAISKVASISQSAGMDIKTTSAFLTQMIATTREAPENLGTALKTIIARFQELKTSEDELEDGVDANKVEKALKSVGVKLRDTTGQFRDFDDVILDLSKKWDTLGRNSQRYVATIAAGSRLSINRLQLAA